MNVKTTLLAAYLLATTSLHAQHFQWAKSFGGAGSGGGSSIHVDAIGNVYTTGEFYETIDFDPGVGTANLTSALKASGFVQKMDASGNFLWVKAFMGTSSMWASSSHVDASGNVYTAGTFAGVADFDPGAGTANLISAGDRDVFVQKMDTSGNFLWVKAFGGGDGDYGESIYVDASGNVYTTGTFAGIADFDPGAGTANLTSAGTNDIFVHKMDASGNFLWAKSFGGTGYGTGMSIHVDASGNVYTTGVFGGMVDFDPGAGTANLSSAGVDQDIFVQKMDASGNFLWAKAFGGPDDDWGVSIDVDASGNVYTTGAFEKTVDFDPGAGTASLSSTGGQDVFVQKMDASGNFLWAKSFGGGGRGWGNSIYVNASGNVYTTGSFEGTVDFDPGAGTANLTSAGYRDIFVQKMSQGPSGIVAIGNGIEVKAYPNPGNGLVQISFEQPLSNVAITVTDLQGSIVYSKQLTTASKEQINIEGSAGVYFLTVTTSEGQSVVKLIKE